MGEKTTGTAAVFSKCIRKVCDQTLLKDMVVLNACYSIVALEEGTCAHEQIIQSGWDSDSFVGSSLVDMYAIWVTFGGC
jgi:hypothetical protein